MPAFNRFLIEFDDETRGLQRTDDALRLPWRDWTSTCDSDAGWREFGFPRRSALELGCVVPDAMWRDASI